MLNFFSAMFGKVNEPEFIPVNVYAVDAVNPELNDVYDVTSKAEYYNLLDSYFKDEEYIEKTIDKNVKLLYLENERGLLNHRVNERFNLIEPVHGVVLVVSNEEVDHSELLRTDTPKIVTTFIPTSKATGTHVLNAMKRSAPEYRRSSRIAKQKKKRSK